MNGDEQRLDRFIREGLGQLRCDREPSTHSVHRAREIMMQEINTTAPSRARTTTRMALIGVLCFAGGAAATTGAARLAGWRYSITPHTDKQDLVVMESDTRTVTIPVEKGDGERIVDVMQNGGMLMEVQGTGTKVIVSPDSK